MHRPDGAAVVVTVISRTEKGFMMDANHPLAGKELTFDLELLEILK
jgi:peptidylprolyl isomerase